MNRGKDPVQHTVYSLRILQSELEAATATAAKVGMKRSEFLRQAIRNETRTAQGVRRGGMSDTKITEYRFVFAPDFESSGIAFIGEPVSLELAEKQMTMIAEYTLLLHDMSLMPYYSNYGYLQMREHGGEWVEVVDE